MDFVNSLVRNSAFWAAVLALVNALVAWLWPDAPPAVAAAANGLLAVVFATLSGQQTTKDVRIVRAARAAHEMVLQQAMNWRAEAAKDAARPDTARGDG